MLLVLTSNFSDYSQAKRSNRRARFHPEVNGKVETN